MPTRAAFYRRAWGAVAAVNVVYWRASPFHETALRMPSKGFSHWREYSWQAEEPPLFQEVEASWEAIILRTVGQRMEQPAIIKSGEGRVKDESIN
jgi:hypothetical protein